MRRSQPLRVGQAPLLILVGALALACGQGGGGPAPAPPAAQTPAASAAAEAPTADDVAGATYAGIYDQPVTLRDGHWEDASLDPGDASRPSVDLIEGIRLTGDLDGDGQEEAVVLLAESSGGSGTQVYLSAVGRRDGWISSIATVRVGDRVQVRSGRFGGGRIDLDVVQQGPEDPACCPTQKATRSWAFLEGALVEVASQITGTVSVADLAGAEWVLRAFDQEPAPPEPEVTLLYEEGKLSGASGCNTYSAPVRDAGPGEMKVGRIGSTRKACPDPVMALEARYLEALGRASRYTVLPNRLLLTYEEDGATHTVHLARRPAPPV